MLPENARLTLRISDEFGSCKVAADHVVGINGARKNMTPTLLAPSMMALQIQASTASL